MALKTTALWFLNTRVSIISGADENTDGLSVLKHWAPFGDSPPLHIHENEDEVFHIIEGEISFTIGDTTIEARTGDTIIAPKRTPHTYCVESQSGAKWLTVTAHRDFEAFVREVARPATAAGLPEPSGPPTPEKAETLARVCEQHGIRLVGAPMAPRLAA